MRRAALGFALPAFLLFAALAPALGAEVTVKHAQGETVLEDTPERVLVFDLASLDTLDSLGVQVTGVAGDFFPGHLAKYAGDEYAKVGSLFEPDYEAVAAADPDLIIIGGRSATKYEALAKIAPTIDLTADNRDYLPSALRHAETLGKIFGKQAEVDARIAKLRKSIEDLKAQAADAGTGLIVLTTGGRLSAFGPGSRFGVLHDAFGIKPAAGHLDTAVHGQAISSEFILKTDPDWLFVIDRDAAIGRAGEAAEQLLDNELVRETKAWKQGHVVYLDPANWYLIGGGLTSLQAQVDQISASLKQKR
ncbi:siderophore ABC transporter substrate-binding protein [Methyloligella sp. GL2]|nr:siderophore ABC transporter substrate-binding protein [Methyloligella sp. GL2]